MFVFQNLSYPRFISNCRSSVLSQERFWELDKFHSKANAVLQEAREHLRKLEYDLCVRRSQEAFELFLKTMFKLIEREYPQEHDISKEIYQVFSVLNQFAFSATNVAQIVHRNRTLGQWRDKSFYGDEKLNVTSLFTELESKVALSYAEEISTTCYRLRDRIWRKINEKKSA
jgi:HEPN domain-containing protein